MAYERDSEGRQRRDGGRPDRSSGRPEWGQRRSEGSGNGRNSQGGDRPYRAREDRPQGDRPYRPRGDGQRSGGNRGRDDRPQGDRPYRAREDRPQGDRPYRPRGDDQRSGGYRGSGDRPQGDRPYRPREDRPQGDRPYRPREDRPQGDRPYRPRGDDQRSGGYRGNGDRPQGDRPYRPRGDDQRSGGYRGRDDRQGGPSRGPRSFNEDREQRPPRPDRADKPRLDVPDIPEEVTASMLDKDTRARLRTLSKDNAEDVGRHLVMAGSVIDEDPELAYRHAQVALARAGRVDVVREAAAVTAYATGRFAEALREFRTVTRLNGSHEHLPLVADCERGLGRPERAIELAQSPEAATLSKAAAAELQLVIAGARADLGQLDAALMILDKLAAAAPELSDRIAEARATFTGDDSQGVVEEVDAKQHTEVPDYIFDDVIVYDLEEGEADERD